jgi:hypothetical protein
LKQDENVRDPYRATAAEILESELVVVSYQAWISDELMDGLIVEPISKLLSG